MNLIDKANLAQDADFRAKVQTAVIKSSADLLNDSSQEFITHQFAKHVRNNIGGNWLNIFVQMVVRDLTSATPDDTDIVNAINGNYFTVAKEFYRNI